MGQIGDFKDNATKHIIAVDFDGVITQRNEYPNLGAPRKYAREVINLLHALGVVVIIWTCRDGEEDTDALRQWLFFEGFDYTDINRVIEHAPFHYESRKIYAHMYVDDAGFGWVDDSHVMIRVLMEFMTKIMKIHPSIAVDVANNIAFGKEIDIEQLKKHIH